MRPNEQAIEISSLGVVLLGEMAGQSKPVDAEPCPRCETGRKIKLDALGWVCSRCLEACVSAVVQSQALKLIEDRGLRARVAYELTLDLYREMEADDFGMLTRAVRYLRDLPKKQEARAANSGPMTKLTMRDS